MKGTENNSLLRFSFTVVLFLILSFIFFESSIIEFSSNVTQMNSKHIIVFTIVTLLTLDVFLPVPSSIVSYAAGNTLPLAWGFICILSGMTIGAVVGYFVGYVLGKTKTYIRVGTKSYGYTAKKLFDLSSLYIMACRGIPILAEVSVLVSGATRLPFWKFFCSIFISNTVLAWAYTYGNELGGFVLIVLGILAIPAITHLIIQLVKWKKSKKLYYG